VIPMIFLAALILAFNILGQTEFVPSFDDDVFSSKEKIQLEKADSVDRRIKIYTEASKRLQKELHEAVIAGDFKFVPANLRQWTLLLVRSLEDIEANLKPKKKYKSLIKYEIQVRKSLAAIRDYRIQAPIDQQDAFDSCLVQAESVHKRLVEKIFPQ
jgi:hypothetical protein